MDSLPCQDTENRPARRSGQNPINDWEGKEAVWSRLQQISSTCPLWENGSSPKPMGLEACNLPVESVGYRNGKGLGDDRTYNARTLASEAAIEDLMVQAKKTSTTSSDDRTRRRHSLNAVFETEKNCLGTCDVEATKKKKSKLSYGPEKFYREDHALQGHNWRLNAKVAQEERRRNFTSGPTAYNGMTRGEALRVHHDD
ncbi:hypothetical protein RB195_012254 [Necator americanus]|uniref:Uncharacterized protein n=1 Tax=Necator americanus TaxID=51031 RepID=A0ABR1D736_NECAM